MDVKNGDKEYLFFLPIHQCVSSTVYSVLSGVKPNNILYPHCKFYICLFDVRGVVFIFSTDCVSTLLGLYWLFQVCQVGNLRNSQEACIPLCPEWRLIETCPALFIAMVLGTCSVSQNPIPLQAISSSCIRLRKNEDSVVTDKHASINIFSSPTIKLIHMLFLQFVFCWFTVNTM